MTTLFFQFQFKNDLLSIYLYMGTFKEYEYVHDLI